MKHTSHKKLPNNKHPLKFSPLEKNKKTNKKGEIV